MCQGSTDVLVAGYTAVDTASADFDALIAQVQAAQVELEAAILVAQPAEPETRRQGRYGTGRRSTSHGGER